MPELIAKPARIPVPGNKIVDEYVGRVNTGTDQASVAHMVSPSGWTEPAQTPDFDEVTVVLRGSVRIEHDGGTLDVRGGQAVVARAGERVRYSTPHPEGAEYISVCVPAFSPDTVHRDVGTST
jgi:mannose-6-phosphate isomerase-like protein (cupin superfamily)